MTFDDPKNGHITSKNNGNTAIYGTCEISGLFFNPWFSLITKRYRATDIT